MNLQELNSVAKALVAKGFVKLENFRRSDLKLAYAYLLTPSGIEEKSRLTLAFLRIKEAEYESIRKEISRLRKEVVECAATTTYSSCPATDDAGEGQRAPKLRADLVEREAK